MSQHLTDDYWESLDIMALFMQIIQQPRPAMHKNPVSQQHPWRVCHGGSGETMDAAIKSMSSVAQAIISSMPLGPLTGCTKAAKPESFDRSRDKAEQFVWSVCIAVTMQLNTFEDERNKYWMLLSFMCLRDSAGLGENRLAWCYPIHPHSPPSPELWPASREPSVIQIRKGQLMRQLHSLKMMTGLDGRWVHGQVWDASKKDWCSIRWHWKTLSSEASLSWSFQGLHGISKMHSSKASHSRSCSGVLSNLITIWPGQLEDCHP